MKFCVSPDSFLFTVMLGALAALPPLSIDMGLPAIPAIEASFLGANGQGPLTLSLFLLGFSVSPLVCGSLSDRYGRKPVLLFGLVLFSLSVGACSFSSTLGNLLGYRLLQGIGAGFCVVMPFAIVRNLFDGAVAQTMTCRGKFPPV